METKNNGSWTYNSPRESKLIEVFNVQYDVRHLSDEMFWKSGMTLDNWERGVFLKFRLFGPYSENHIPSSLLPPLQPFLYNLDAANIEYSEEATAT